MAAYQVIQKDNVPMFVVLPFGDVEAIEDYMDELWANDVVRQYEASENNTILYTMSDAKKILAV